MVSRFEACLTAMLRGKPLLLALLVISLLPVFVGCATVGSTSLAPTMDYGTYARDVDQDLKKSTMLGDGYYLRESVKQRILDESLRSIQKGDIETSELDMVRKAYLTYTRALIETGDFQKASVICAQGIELGNAIANAISELYKRKPSQGFSRGVATWLVNTSILPHTDNDAYLRRLYLYKTYIVWFTTGDKQKAFHTYEEFLKTTPLKEDKIFLLMDRGAFYSVVMGDFQKSLTEFNTAADEIEKMHLVNIDMRYIYSMEMSTRRSDIYLKLGKLSDAEKVLLQGERQRQGLFYKVGGFVAALQQGNMAIVKSKMGALYALLRDFNKSNEYFTEALGKVKDIDPNTTDMLHKKVLSTYYINYGAFYLGLQGEYDKASESVDKGIEHTRHYYLESVQSEPNLETAYLLSGEIHFQLKSYDKAISRAMEGLELAKKHYNRVAELSAHTLLGMVYFDKGDINSAKQEYEKALQSAKLIPSTENWKLYYGLGQVYESLGSSGKAMKFYEDAVKEVERLWEGRFNDAQKQVSFIDNRLVVFEPIIRMLAQQGKADEVVRYMELSKSRTFFETSIFSVETGGKTEAQGQLTKEEKERLAKLKEEMRDISERIDSTSSRIQTIQGVLELQSKGQSKRGVKVKNKEEQKDNPDAAPSKPITKAEAKKLAGEKTSLQKNLMGG
ncbi:MAG: tetratricopeptide repeat protein, partial [Deltaproteobacteria bacterium]